MLNVTAKGGVGSFGVLITNDADRHPAHLWAETTADQLVELNPYARDPERIRKSLALRDTIIEILEPLFGQASRPSTERVMELIKQASHDTPWDEAFAHFSKPMQIVIERNLNTIYPEGN